MSPEEILEAKLRVIDESHRFQPGRTALVVIDMQHGFIDEGASLAFPEAGEIISNLAELITACR